MKEGEGLSVEGLEGHAPERVPFGGAWQQETTRPRDGVPARGVRQAEPASDPSPLRPLIDGRIPPPEQFSVPRARCTLRQTPRPPNSSL